jgi:hypothetical protein
MDFFSCAFGRPFRCWVEMSAIRGSRTSPRSLSSINRMMMEALKSLMCVGKPLAKIHPFIKEIANPNGLPSS